MQSEPELELEASHVRYSATFSECRVTVSQAWGSTSPVRGKPFLKSHRIVSPSFSFLPLCLLLPFSFFFFFFVFLPFLGPLLRHMKVPRLGVQSELQPPAYTTATATRDLSCVFDLHHSSWQHQILNPVNEARDRTCVLTDTSRVHSPLSHDRNS